MGGLVGVIELVKLRASPVVKGEKPGGTCGAGCARWYRYGAEFAWRPERATVAQADLHSPRGENHIW